ncbi:unnamed protein product [Mycena citricolor]|uniref:N2227-domain-containing protein n=1 Tax=Mycena citricolor TaxID=2018698 RepID=A0AAD2HUC9_9AGAR|nr:unnamed protein product [Mycena citricolor]
MPSFKPNSCWIPSSIAKLPLGCHACISTSRAVSFSITASHMADAGPRATATGPTHGLTAQRLAFIDIRRSRPNPHVFRGHRALEVSSEHLLGVWIGGTWRSAGGRKIKASVHSIRDPFRVSLRDGGRGDQHSSSKTACMQILWTSDVWLALALPCTVTFIIWRLSLLPRSWAELRDLLALRSLDAAEAGAFSLQRAHNAFARYRHLSTAEFAHLRAAYASISRPHKRLGYTLGYPAKLDSLAQVTDANGRVTDAIARLAEDDLGFDVPPRGGSSADLMRVREALKHYVRDWSSDGRSERDHIFAPILDVLRAVDRREREGMRVLVPGSGLGRLAWEISELGFLTTANELSYFMTLALRLLLSESRTSAIDQHTIHPYAHWFSHQRSSYSLFRPMSFPDALPRLSPTFELLEKDFLTLRKPAASAGYDYIVTLFFIDTSLNVFTTLEQIYHLLRPGGTWINLGPLLWTSGAEAKVELSLDEVLQAVQEIGFVIQGQEDGQRSRTVECEYTGDSRAMMRWIYRAEFWVAQKPE